jgi:hypothetical protein
MSKSHENKEVIPGLAVTHNSAIVHGGGKSMENFPPNFTQVLSELMAAQSQQLVDEIPGFTKQKVNDFKSELWTELGTAMGNILSNQVAQKMSTPEFAEAMKEVISSGKMPVMFAQQLSLVNEIIDQRLDAYKRQYFKEFEDESKKREVQRRKEIDELREKQRIAHYTRQSWALAFTEAWVLWTAFGMGLVLAAPLWINWPAAVGCDRQDLVCTVVRFRDVKLIRGK